MVRWSNLWTYKSEDLANKSGCLVFTVTYVHLLHFKSGDLWDQTGPKIRAPLVIWLNLVTMLVCCNRRKYFSLLSSASAAVSPRHPPSSSTSSSSISIVPTSPQPRLSLSMSLEPHHPLLEVTILAAVSFLSCTRHPRPRSLSSAPP
jgi:hypothetical protein